MHSSLKYLLQKAFADALKIYQSTNNASVYDHSRRLFLKKSSILTGAAIASTAFPPLWAKNKKDLKIAIIGAGMAGLNAAYQLKKWGINATVYEASARTGGRMLTIKDNFGQGITTDLGGEFVDTTHLDIIELAKEFGIEFYDLRKDTISEGVFYFDGKNYTNEDIKNALIPFVPQMVKDIESLPSVLDYTTGKQFAFLDEQSITQYLNTLGVKDWLYHFLELVLTREYGMEASEQSAINFLIMFVAPSNEPYDLFGKDHEVLKIKGGSQHLTNTLYNQIKNQVRLNYTLTKISKHTHTYELIFNNDGVQTHTTADYVIMAIPFSILRHIELDLPLPAQKLACINQLGYGNSSKFILGFNEKPWRKNHKNGQTYTDKSFGCAWDSSRSQSEEKGSLTVFGGGDMVKQITESTTQQLSDKYLNDLEEIYPTSIESYNQLSTKFCWPQNPYSKAAYSSFKVGQWSTLAGWEIKPIDNLLFAGEHCSLDFQGYMNGAAQTGRLAAEEIMKRITNKIDK